MRIGIVIYSNDPETVWNAFRFGVFSIKQKDSVEVFLLGKGVEIESIHDERFNVAEQVTSFSEAGGTIYACGSCLKSRNSEGSEVCPLSTMADLHRIVSECDKVLTF